MPRARDERAWNDGCNRLRGHLSANNDQYPVSSTTLGRWVSNQRYLYNIGRLSAAKISVLEALPNWQWNVRTANWDDTFVRLAAYLSVSEGSYPSDSSDKSLTLWIRKQRTEKADGMLSANRVLQLEQLPNWSWIPPRDEIWNEKYELLRAYVLRNGTYPSRGCPNGLDTAQIDPILFKSLGLGSDSALLNTVIVGAVNVVATLVAIFTVDRLGRKFLFIEGGAQMLSSMVVTAVVLAVEFSKYPDGVLPSGTAIGILVVICVFVAAFAWSWGPLGWLVPSEIQTLETRAAGMSAAVFINFLLSFIIGQTFVSMLCAMKWGVFLFFGGWVMIMTTFIIFFVPETRHVPVERVSLLFARHKIWRKLMGSHADDIISDFQTFAAVHKASALEDAGGKKSSAEPIEIEVLGTRTSSLWNQCYNITSQELSFDNGERSNKEEEHNSEQHDASDNSTET
eukprot:jgi/Picsp_1/45/NSC_00045-R1_hexose transporter